MGLFHVQNDPDFLLPLNKCDDKNRKRDAF